MTILPNLIRQIEDALFAHPSISRVAEEIANYLIRRFEEHIRSGASAGTFLSGPIISTHAQSSDLPDSVHASVIGPGEAGVPKSLHWDAVPLTFTPKELP